MISLEKKNVQLETDDCYRRKNSCLVESGMSIKSFILYKNQ